MTGENVSDLVSYSHLTLKCSKNKYHNLVPSKRFELLENNLSPQQQVQYIRITYTDCKWRSNGRDWNTRTKLMTVMFLCITCILHLGIACKCWPYTLEFITQTVELWNRWNRV